MDRFVSRLDLIFSSPEEYIFKQGETAGKRNIFFVSDGECVANLRDHKGEIH